MRDRLIFWRKKMGAVNGKTWSIKERKKNSKKVKKETPTSFVTLLCVLENIFFPVITFRGKVF